MPDPKGRLLVALGENEDAILEDIRKHYLEDENWKYLVEMSRQSLTSLYVVAGEITEAVIRVFYERRDSDGKVLRPFQKDERERELLLVGILASRNGGIYLGVHVYWALMVGLSVKDIAEAILLQSVYTGGISSYHRATTDAMNTLQLIKAIYDEQGTVTPQVAFPRLAAFFSDNSAINDAVVTVKALQQVVAESPTDEELLMGIRRLFQAKGVMLVPSLAGIRAAE
jgi:alkylhydroperoxidase/carboxymuconolactone decarboxylase family protein YurZ